jgi:signal transduction histidine kinase
MNRFQLIGLLAVFYINASSAIAQDNATNLQTLWQQFYQQAGLLSPKQNLSQADINRYPKSLLLSSSQYPIFSQFHWHEIQQLWQIGHQCQQNRSLATKINSQSSALQEMKFKETKLQDAIEFELALCQRKPLANSWFDEKPLLHPAGGSYADRYLASLEKPHRDRFLAQHQGQLTLANQEHPLHALLSGLSPQGVDALLSGYRAYLTEQDTLWLNSDSGWKAIDANQWQPLAHSMKLAIADNTAAVCSFRYSNICLNGATPASQLTRWIIALSALVIAFLITRNLYQRRQNAKERQFILQLLTHELRTPITSLGFTVEMFRDQFDELSDNAQQTVWRLMADHQRLTQLAETSKGYLSSQPEEQFQHQSAYLSDWLDHCLEKHSLDYTLNEDREVNLPYYWLGICLENLVKNAQHHGKGNIVIDIHVDQVLRIQVSDQGEFPNITQRWLTLIRPSISQTNMGIGLTIVSRLMKQMGGKLICQRKPTRCILELPL